MVKPFKVIEAFIDQQDRIADFVQNGPSDGIAGYVRDQYRTRCNQFANLPAWARALGNGSAGTMNRICTPYWNDNGWDGPVSASQFDGGQCAVLYNFTFTSTRSSGQVQNRFINGILGPVTGWTLTAVGASWIIRVTGAGPAATQAIESTTLPAPTISNVQVVRQDGLPDNCGNLPPEFNPGPNPPPNPPPTPGPEPTDDPFGGPIPDLPIPPYQDPIFGPTPIDPGDEPEGGGGAPGSPAGGDGLPGDPDAVGSPAGSTGGDGEGQDFDFGPPPDGRVWVGALVENTVDSRYGNIAGTGPGNTVYPYVIGNASLIYAGGRSSSSRMRSRWHEMFRPVTALQVTGARLQCRPGVSASVRPVSATICPEDTCGDNSDG